MPTQSPHWLKSLTKLTVSSRCILSYSSTYRHVNATLLCISVQHYCLCQCNTFLCQWNTVFYVSATLLCMSVQNCFVWCNAVVYVIATFWVSQSSIFFRKKNDSYSSSSDLFYVSVIVGWNQDQAYIPWSSGDTALSVWTSSTDTKASSSEVLTDSGDLWNEVGSHSMVNKLYCQYGGSALLSCSGKTTLLSFSQC